MSKASAFVKKELREMIPPTLFFFVVFQTLVVTRSLMGVEDGVSMTSTAAAALGALIVGKAVLIADALPLFEWFRRRLLVNVAWRALLYLLVATLFQFLEEFIPLAREHGVAQGFAELGEEMDWDRFWGTHILLAVFLFFYAFASAAVDVIGHQRFYAVFLGASAVPDAADDEVATS